MIALNEAGRIASAIESVSWADQIVLIDCESTDDTAGIARKLGAEVYCEPNKPAFDDIKNSAIQKCTGDWVLVLDADEQVSYELAGEIRRVISEGSHTGYAMPRQNYALGKPLRYGSQYPDYQIRLFKAGTGHYSTERLHQKVTVDGSIGKMSVPLDHYPYDNFQEILRKGTRYLEFEAQYMFGQGVRVSSLGMIQKAGIAPMIRFWRRYLLKGGFLDGVPGLIMALFDLWNHSMRYMRLWDLQRLAEQKQMKEAK